MIIPQAKRAWSCWLCGFVYLTRQDYKAHYRREHGQLPLDVAVERIHAARRLMKLAARDG